MISYGIYSEQELIVVKVWGTLNLEHFLSFVARLRADSRHEPTFKGVCDFRGVETTLGLDEVQQCMGEIAKLPDHSLSMWALLVGTPRTTTSATTYKDCCKYLHQAKTFLTVKAAGNWLGKDLSACLPVSC